MSKEEVSSDKNEYIVISLEDSQEQVPLKRVRKILQTYHHDSIDYDNAKDKQRLGKVLTIIDGSIADPTQRKAVKDMVHDIWYQPTHTDRLDSPPMLWQATDAIGFSLYGAPDDSPLENVRYNKYKEM